MVINPKTRVHSPACNSRRNSGVNSFSKGYWNAIPWNFGGEKREDAFGHFRNSFMLDKFRGSFFFNFFVFFFGRCVRMSTSGSVRFTRPSPPAEAL